MEFGLSTSVLGVRAMPGCLAILAEHGVRWVEIHGYTPEEFDFGNGALVEATRRACERGGPHRVAARRERSAVHRRPARPGS